MPTLEEIAQRDILEIMGAHNLDQETKSELYTKLYQTLQNMVLARIAETLDQQQMRQFVEILDDGSHQKIAEYLSERNIDIKKLFAQEAIALKIQMSSLMEVAKDKKASQNGHDGTAA